MVGSPGGRSPRRAVSRGGPVMYLATLAVIWMPLPGVASESPGPARQPRFSPLFRALTQPTGQRMTDQIAAARGDGTGPLAARLPGLARLRPGLRPLRGLGALDG